MTLGAAAGSRRRTPPASATNVITNGTFDSGASWSNVSGAKSISGGKLHYVNGGSSTAVWQDVTLTVGKYYELTYTISGWTQGNIRGLFVGGTSSNGTLRSADGTYVERILVNTSNNQLWLQIGTGPATLDVDDVSLYGPYNTSTVGGA